MSKIQSEITKATGVKASGSDRQVIILVMMAGISALSDDGWEGLSKESQDWFNAAADAKNAKKKTLPDFPDFEEDAEVEAEKEEPKTSSRRASKKEEEVKVGSSVTLTTKRGKVITGKLVERDDEVIVLDVDGKEEEFDVSRVESVTAVAEKAAETADDEPAEPEIKPGTDVTLTTKRGKTVTGKIVEMDDEVIVLDVDGKEEEFNRDRVENIKPVAVAAKTEAKSTSRRGADEPAKEDKEKPTRVSNREGVSIGTRIKELVADDMSATQADIGKLLKKEGIEFKDNTLNLNYVDAHKFVTILKAKKLLK